MLTIAVAIGGTATTIGLLRRGRRESAGAQVRRLVPGTGWRVPPRVRARAERALADAGVERTPEEACELWLVGVAAGALLAVAIAPGLVVAVGATAIAGPPVALRVARGRARRQFVASVPAMLEQVSAALRGGSSLAESLEVVAASGGSTAADVRRVVRRAALGVTLAESLRRWPDERPVPSVRAAAGALALAATVGGRAANAIDGLAISLRERMAATAEARSLSAQARLSAVVVGAAPVAYLAAGAVLDPGSVGALVESGTGRACLGIGLALDALAVLWMRRIVRDDED